LRLSEIRLTAVVVPQQIAL